MSDTVDQYTTGDGLTNTEWANALREHILLGQVCSECDTTTATPIAACSQCGSRDLKVLQLPKEGEVYSETTIHVPPVDFESPYQIALVSIGDACITARIDGHTEIGDMVSFEDVIETDRNPAPVFTQK